MSGLKTLCLLHVSKIFIRERLKAAQAHTKGVGND